MSIRSQNNTNNIQVAESSSGEHGVTVYSNPPEKSKMKYANTYRVFKEWCAEKEHERVTEDVLLEYLEAKSNISKPSTLWAIYSMLKCTLGANENLDTTQFKKIVPFLKKKSIGHCPKKSKILTPEEINKFIMEADDKKYLMMKVVLIMGVLGRCSRHELVNITVDDIEDRESVIIVKVPEVMTNTTRTFTIINLDYMAICRKYAALRPPQASTPRFFMKYQNGRIINQVVGVNKIGTIPSLIAQYLNLADPELYTSHCFRYRKRAAVPSLDATVESEFCTTIINDELQILPDADEQQDHDNLSIEDLKMEMFDNVSHDEDMDHDVDDKSGILKEDLSEYGAESSGDIRNITISNKILQFDITDSTVKVQQKNKPADSSSSSNDEKKTDNEKHVPSIDEINAAISSAGITFGTCINCTINFNFIKK